QILQVDASCTNRGPASPPEVWALRQYRLNPATLALRKAPVDPPVIPYRDREPRTQSNFGTEFSTTPGLFQFHNDTSTLSSLPFVSSSMNAGGGATQ
ncbi:hypothetical protein ABG768_017703, partial [Culter alburnus]